MRYHNVTSIKKLLKSLTQHITEWSAGISASNKRRRYFMSLLNLMASPEYFDLLEALQRSFPQSAVRLMRCYVNCLTVACDLDGYIAVGNITGVFAECRAMRKQTAMLIDTLTTETEKMKERRRG